MDILTFVFIILAVALGFAAGWILRHKTQAQGQRVVAERLALENQMQTQNAVLEATDQLRNELATHKEQVASLSTAKAGLENQLSQKQDELAERDKRYAALVAEHQERQAKDEVARRQQREEEQTVLKQMAPLEDKVNKLMAEITRQEAQRATQHGELSEKISNMLETESSLRGVAESLASALNSSNTRGQWGEMQLRKIIEDAGLLSRVDFLEQVVIEGENGQLKPDAVVYMPQGRAIAIDAKAPFDNLLRAQKLSESDPVQKRERDELLKKHTEALKNHITVLAKREYPAALGKLNETLDMVILFLPSESLLSAALHEDPALLENAFRKGIALASPTTLWAVLKAVGYAWQQNRLTEEAQELYVNAKELVARISTGIGHFNKLGNSLKQATNHYNSFVGSYESKILPKARVIGEMSDLKLTEVSGQLDAEPRSFNKAESLAAIAKHNAEVDTEPESN